jgi:hypothetical protein
MEFDSPRLLELLRNPAEDLAFEIKDWLNLGDNAHKALLAQALIALANHGGGAVLIGYAEQGNGSFIPAEPRPPDLSGYTPDIVNEISRAYLNPPVHCEVRHIEHPDSGLLFPVINVPVGTAFRSWRNAAVRKGRASSRQDALTFAVSVPHPRSLNLRTSGERFSTVVFDRGGRSWSIEFD